MDFVDDLAAGFPCERVWMSDWKVRSWGFSSLQRMSCRVTRTILGIINRRRVLSEQS